MKDMTPQEKLAAELRAHASDCREAADLNTDVVLQFDQLAAMAEAMDSAAATLLSEQGEVTITTDASGRCVAVTRQDGEGRILSVIWEASEHGGGGEAGHAGYLVDGSYFYYAVACSHNFATAKPDILPTEQEHILGLCRVVQKLRAALTPSSAPRGEEVQSRSRLRSIAAEKGEPAPRFDHIADADKKVAASEHGLADTLDAIADDTRAHSLNGEQHGALRKAAALIRRLAASGQSDKLQAFKDYTHQRLDAMGVPVDPDSPHKAAGCRIGGRLDWIEQRLAASGQGVDHG